MTTDKSPRRRPSPVRAVEPAPGAPAREPSRMMGLLIVDVLAARKVDQPAARPRKPAKKSARA